LQSEKINEYLCSNFVANTILTSVVPDKHEGGEHVKHISRRAGTIEEIINHDFVLSPKDVMLYDQGSTNYKNWLEK
jgi:hypothetical protein